MGAQVADSKDLTETDRESLFERITDPRFKGRTAWAIAEVQASDIDKTNILRASLTAMARAVHELPERPDCVLVDGCNRPPELLRLGEEWTRGSKAAELAKNDVKQHKLAKFFGAIKRPEPSPEGPWRPGHVEAVIDGDARVPSVSAASILAKVRRDRLMSELDARFPVYGFAAHKGYGTAAHMEAIRRHGVCQEHRRSFAPIKEFLEQSAAADDTATPTVGRGAVLRALGAHTPEAPSRLRDGAS